MKHLARQTSSQCLLVREINVGRRQAGVRGSRASGVFNGEAHYHWQDTHAFSTRKY